ncbi:MAG: acyl-CoA dehydrogenase domain protein [Frankiales bacterium]|nr:acyl-CoA dehydrogenase domain protein [Frankiales bacterium]
MDFTPSARTVELQAELTDFLHTRVLPSEAVLEEQLAAADDPLRYEPPVKEELKAEARARGLWNLFLAGGSPHGAGLTNLEYAPLAETMGWSPDLLPEATNCSAPDTGNMELLELFATPSQRERWLAPLLAGEIRSCFSMTEPDVASSDARNIATRIRRDGDEYVITGRKWWASGALRERCELLLVLGVTDPDADSSRRHSMVLVPRDTPGVRIVRSTTVFGYEHASVGGHAEIVFDDVRVPAENLLGSEGAGFAMAQARLGPGRIHHCMRLLGQAERALELMCRRALSRTAFGMPLAEQGVVQQQIAESRMEIDQARLIVLKTAALIDTVGNRGARIEISTIKAVVPRTVARVVDRAIQVHGAAGVSDDFPLARMWTEGRYLRLGDGPDEVHIAAVARQELGRHQPAP